MEAFQVKRTLHRTIAAEQRKIDRRLGDAVRVNDDGPVLSAPTIRYELAEKTKAIAHGVDGRHPSLGPADRAGRLHQQHRPGVQDPSALL